MDVDYSETWYHGSPLRLETLREGSTITQWRDLARVFSHKPTLVSISDDREIQHNGTRPGYLYEIVDPVGPDDVRPHPRTTMAPGDEWLTNRPLRLRLIAETTVKEEEFLTEADIADLMKRSRE